MKRIWLWGAAGAMLFMAVPAAAQQLVTNGGFEAGNTGFTSGYTYVGTPGPTAMYPEGTYTVGANAADYHNLWANVAAHTGTNYLIANGAPGNNVNVWTQSLATMIGRTYNFSAFINNVCCNGSFNGANGTPVIVAVNGGALQVASGAANNMNQWVRLAGTFTATSASTTLSIFNDNSIASGNDFGLDDISVTAAVPEPASWAMMIGGFGLMGAAMRRRKAAGRPIFA